MNPGVLNYGCAFYPEVFGPPTKKDLQNLHNLNMNFVRMGEFAWSTFEPEPGEYHFELFEETIEILGKEGFRTVLCTPGATPPIWLTHNHPERCVLDRDGKRYTAGGRQHICWNNSVFQEKLADLTGEMVNRFGRNPYVIGWQIDNELRSAVPECCCETCRELWHVWLKEQFGTIEKLNSAWHTSIWSMRYRNFEEVPVPGVTTFTRMSPQLELAYREFGEDSAIRYQQMQCDIIRKGSSAPITLNDGATHHLNRAKQFASLDFASVDCYTTPESCETFLTVCEIFRSLKKGVPYWIMETSPAQAGSMLYCAPILPENYVRNEVISAFASGAGGFAYWHFRQHPAGLEMPHSALLTSWGDPSVGFSEAASAGKWIQENRDFLLKTRLIPAQAALICSDAGKIRQQSEPIGDQDINYHFQQTVKFASILRETVGCFDILPDDSDAGEYRLLWSANMPYLSPAEREKGLSVAEKGGVWIVGPATGCRDRYGCAYLESSLEPELERICGLRPAWCYSATGGKEKGVGFSRETTLHGWSHFFEAENETAIGVMTNGRSKGKAFAIEQNYGKGKIVILGALPDQDFLKAMVCHYRDFLNLPELKADCGNALFRRSGDDGEFAVALNLNGKDGKIAFFKEEFSLSPFEVRIIKRT